MVVIMGQIVGVQIQMVICVTLVVQKWRLIMDGFVMKSVVKVGPIAGPPADWGRCKSKT